jgi:hypothetical protein
MSEAENNEFVARLEKIERENRILKRCVALILVAIGAVFVMAQAQSRPRTLEAEKLVIRYPNGKEAIVLGTYPSAITEWPTSLPLHDKNGNLPRSLSPSAEFINESGVVGATISADPIGGEVHVNSPTAELQMGISTNPQFSPSDVRTRTGESVSFSIIRTTKSQPFQPMFEIDADTTGEVTQWMIPKGADGAQLRLTTGPDGASVQLWDNPKLLRAVLGTVKLETVRSGGVESLPLSSLVLFDKEGKLLWRAP